MPAGRLSCYGLGKQPSPNETRGHRTSHASSNVYILVVFETMCSPATEVKDVCPSAVKSSGSKVVGNAFRPYTFRLSCNIEVESVCV